VQYIPQGPGSVKKDYFYPIDKRMWWPKNIRRNGVLKGIFFLVGLILFTAQLSGKFYWSASMPVSVSASDSHGLRLMDGNIHGARLSLDKRYDLTTAFGLPEPTIRATHFFKGIQPSLRLQAGDLLCGVPVLTLLRGPPSHID
jgi:hypothetical protein